MRSLRLLTLAALALLVAPLLLRADDESAYAGLRAYPSRYYQVFTDLDPDVAREATLRLSVMAEEYHQRTRGFAGTIRSRLPFLMFRGYEEYVKAGGMPGTAGVFDGRRLMAYAGEKVSDETWHVIQHEGFHQFVNAVIGGDVPIWVNEGLAEYFGDGVFTGDSYITGMITEKRLKRLKKALAAGKLRPLTEMMTLSHARWNAEMTSANYDQAWSMVYFLANGDRGRYQSAFDNFMRAISRGTPYAVAWQRSFGGVEAFEERWRAYWENLPEQHSDRYVAHATIATMTSYYARAFSQGQRFDSFEAFIKAAKAGELKAAEEDWLPPSLLEEALARVPEVGQWELRTRGKHRLMLTTPDGGKFIGQFTVQRGRVKKVEALDRTRGR